MYQPFFTKYYLQPCTYSNIADLEQHDRVFDADLRQDCLPSSREDLDCNFQPYSSIISSGLELQNDDIIAGFENPCFPSPTESLELHSKDHFQPFFSSYLVDFPHFSRLFDKVKNSGNFPAFKSFIE